MMERHELSSPSQSSDTMRWLHIESLARHSEIDMNKFHLNFTRTFSSQRFHTKK